MIQLLVGLSCAPSVIIVGRASDGKVLEGDMLGSTSEAKSRLLFLRSPWKS